MQYDNAKKRKIDADTIEITGATTEYSPLTMMAGTSAVTPLKFQYTSQESFIFTNAAGSARTDVGTALTAHCTKSNGFVSIILEIGNLNTTALAVAGAAMIFNEFLPLRFCPSGSLTIVVQVINNGSGVAGAIQLQVNGVNGGSFVINASQTGGNFTNGANCQVKQYPGVIMGRALQANT